MIAYLDSSAVVRMYLTDESGDRSAHDLIRNPLVNTVTGSWTRIEALSAFSRAQRTGRFEFSALESAFLRDTDPASGMLFIVDSSQAEVESVALQIVREYGLRAMDAWQLACAQLTFESLAEAREERAFVTHDAEQAAVAEQWGYTVI